MPSISLHDIAQGSEIYLTVPISYPGDIGEIFNGLYGASSKEHFLTWLIKSNEQNNDLNPNKIFL